VKGRVWVVAAVLAVGGCGGGAASPSPTPEAAAAAGPLDACRSAAHAWTPLPTTGYYRSRAARAGEGPFGIVFVNDSDNDPCSWTGLANRLAGRGYAVAVFDSPSAGYEAGQALAVAAALRRDAGVQRVVMIGASVGARAVIQIGAQHPRAAAGVVALSAERMVRYGGDLLPLARRVGVPVLSVGSRGDALTVFGKDTRVWDRTIPRVHTLMLTGADHGVDFLHDRHRAQVQAAILSFLRTCEQRCR
jgi:pimeloyl-ACP methyl ester carboxylesterase